LSRTLQWQAAKADPFWSLSAHCQFVSRKHIAISQFSTYRLVGESVHCPGPGARHSESGDKFRQQKEGQYNSPQTAMEFSPCRLGGGHRTSVRRRPFFVFVPGQSSQRLLNVLGQSHRESSAESKKMNTRRAVWTQETTSGFRQQVFIMYHGTSVEGAIGILNNGFRYITCDDLK